MKDEGDGSKEEEAKVRSLSTLGSIDPSPSSLIHHPSSSRAGVLVGCTGWSYPDWVGPFYAPGTPPEEWLTHYARAFNFAEIDSTFYAEPAVERVRAWAARTPRGFVFSPKVPRAITHDAKLRNVDGLAASFLKAVEPLRAEGKLGPIVLQLPPSFRYDLDADALAAFVRAWPARVPLAVELRHASWWREETYAVLRDANATLVWSTNETGRTPPVSTSGSLYVRFVGDRKLDETGGRWGGIQREQADEWERWRDVLRNAREEADFLYFVANNHFMGFAPETARRAAGLLGVPEPDLARAARAERQRGLGDFLGGAP